MLCNVEALIESKHAKATAIKSGRFRASFFDGSHLVGVDDYPKKMVTPDEPTVRHIRTSIHSRMVSLRSAYLLVL